MRTALPIALPILCGGLFWATVLVNHLLYQTQTISVGGAAMVELAELCIALISFGYAIRGIFRFLRAGRFLFALLTAAAVFVGLFLITRGFDGGAALMWAT